MTHRPAAASRRPAAGLACLALLGLSGIWFAFQVAVSLSMPVYGDELTKIIAAQMILDGGQLYEDIFHHHSPLIFAVVQPVAFLFGIDTLTPFRLACALLFVLCAAAVAWSPLHRDWRSRCLAAALFLATAGALYNGVSLFRLMYQSVTGVFVATVLALFVLPLLARARPNARQAAVAGLAASFAVGTNIGVIAPLLVMLIAALAVAYGRHRRDRTAPRPPVAPFAAAAAAAVALTVAWVGVFGDYRGFFVFNIRFNTEIYAPYVAYHPLEPLRTVVYLVVGAFPATFIFVFGLMAVGGLVFLAQRLRDRACGPFWIAVPLIGALGLALVYLNMRGGVTWHTGTAAVVAAAFFSLVVAGLWSAAPDTVGPRLRKAVVAGLVLIGVAGSVAYYLTAIESPTRVRIARQMPDFRDPLVVGRQTPYVQYIRRVTRPDEPIYAMPFAPRLYLFAQRKPASGHFFYLPWQADYELAPADGLSIDLCRDLETRRPPVVHLVARHFAGKNVEDYAGCVFRLVARDYQQHPRWRTLFVRRDVYAKFAAGAPR